MKPKPSLEEVKYLRSCPSQQLKMSQQEQQYQRSIVLEAVTENWWALEYASADLKSDEEVLAAAVQQSWNALQFAIEPLPPTHRGIMLAAVQQSGMALQYASPELCADEKVVLAAVKQAGIALKWASPELQNTRKVVLAAVKQDENALAYASGALRIDHEIMLVAITKTLTAVQAKAAADVESSIAREVALAQKLEAAEVHAAFLASQVEDPNSSPMQAANANYTAACKLELKGKFAALKTLLKDQGQQADALARIKAGENADEGAHAAIEQEQQVQTTAASELAEKSNLLVKEIEVLLSHDSDGANGRAAASDGADLYRTLMPPEMEVITSQLAEIKRNGAEAFNAHAAREKALKVNVMAIESNLKGFSAALESAQALFDAKEKASQMAIDEASKEIAALKDKCDASEAKVHLSEQTFADREKELTKKFVLLAVEKENAVVASAEAAASRAAAAAEASSKLANIQYNTLLESKIAAEKEADNLLKQLRTLQAFSKNSEEALKAAQDKVTSLLADLDALREEHLDALREEQSKTMEDNAQLIEARNAAIDENSRTSITLDTEVRAREALEDRIKDAEALLETMSAKETMHAQLEQERIEELESKAAEVEELSKLIRDLSNKFEVLQTKAADDEVAHSAREQELKEQVASTEYFAKTEAQAAVVEIKVLSEKLATSEANSAEEYSTYMERERALQNEISAKDEERRMAEEYWAEERTALSTTIAEFDEKLDIVQADHAAQEEMLAEDNAALKAALTSVQAQFEALTESSSAEIEALHKRVLEMEAEAVETEECRDQLERAHKLELETTEASLTSLERNVQALKEELAATRIAADNSEAAFRDKEQDLQDQVQMAEVRAQESAASFAAEVEALMDSEVERLTRMLDETKAKAAEDLAAQNEHEKQLQARVKALEITSRSSAAKANELMEKLTTSCTNAGSPYKRMATKSTDFDASYGAAPEVSMDRLSEAVATAQAVIQELLDESNETAELLRNERASAEAAAAANELALREARQEASEGAQDTIASLESSLKEAQDKVDALNSSLRSQRAVTDAMVKNMQNEERETERLLAEKTRECERRKREIASLLGERPRGSSVSSTPFRTIKSAQGDSSASAADLETSADLGTAKPYRPSPRRPSPRTNSDTKASADAAPVEALVLTTSPKILPRRGSLPTSPKIAPKPASSSSSPLLRRANGGSAKVPMSKVDWTHQSPKRNNTDSPESLKSFRVMSPSLQARNLSKELADGHENSTKISPPKEKSTSGSPSKPPKLLRGLSNSTSSPTNVSADDDNGEDKTVDYLRERRLKLAERRAQVRSFT